MSDLGSDRDSMSDDFEDMVEDVQNLITRHRVGSPGNRGGSPGNHLGGSPSNKVWIHISIVIKYVIDSLVDKISLVIGSHLLDV